jgi:hypothetical protein
MVVCRQSVILIGDAAASITGTSAILGESPFSGAIGSDRPGSLSGGFNFGRRLNYQPRVGQGGLIGRRFHGLFQNTADCDQRALAPFVNDGAD